MSVIGQQQNRRWISDPIVRWLISGTIVLGLLHAFLLTIVPSGTVLVVFTWFIPAVVSFGMLASASITFLCFGRYLVLRQPSSFWIGLAFSTFTVLNVYFLAAFPGLVPDQNALIADFPNTSAWLSSSNASLLTIFLIVGIFARVPKKDKKKNRQWLWLWLSFTIVIAAMAGLIVIFEHVMPTLIDRGAFSPWFIINFYVIMAISLAGTLLSIWKYRQTGDSLFGYLALTELVFAFAFLDDATGLVRYSLLWYCGSLMAIIGRLIMLFGLLSEYVGLYRRERQRTHDLEALQQVTAPSLAIGGQDVLLHALLEKLTTMMDANAAAILLVDSAKQTWTVRAEVGILEGQTGTLDMNLGEGFARQLATVRATRCVNDFQSDLNTWSPHAVPTNVKSIIGTPIAINDEILGAVLVFCPVSREFGRQEQHLIETVAERVAVSLEAVRFHRQEEQWAVMEERQRLARDLHDSVTQSLCSAEMYLEAGIRLLSSGSNDAAMEHLFDVRGMTREVMREMRLLIFELRPPVLEKEGLVAALQTRLDAVETRTGLQTELFVEGEQRWPSIIEEEIYRIAQEALNNVLKHAQAKHVKVSLTAKHGETVLEVQDDGNGFDPKSASFSGGLGLQSMAERAERVGGTLNIDSLPGKGTTVRFRIVVQAQSLALPSGFSDGER